LKKFLNILPADCLGFGVSTSLALALAVVLPLLLLLLLLWAAGLLTKLWVYMVYIITTDNINDVLRKHKRFKLFYV